MSSNTKDHGDTPAEQIADNLHDVLLNELLDRSIEDDDQALVIVLASIHILVRRVFLAITDVTTRIRLWKAMSERMTADIFPAADVLAEMKRQMEILQASVDQEEQDAAKELRIFFGTTGGQA